MEDLKHHGLNESLLHHTVLNLKNENEVSKNVDVFIKKEVDEGQMPIKVDPGGNLLQNTELNLKNENEDSSETVVIKKEVDVDQLKPERIPIDIDHDGIDVKGEKNDATENGCREPCLEFVNCDSFVKTEPIDTMKEEIDVGPYVKHEPLYNEPESKMNLSLHLGDVNKIENDAIQPSDLSANAECNVGNEQFPSKESLDKHAFIHHLKNEPDDPSNVKSDHVDSGKLVCKTCPKKDTHLETEDDLNRYECGICGKLYKTTRYLRDHILGHEAVRVHKCQYCEKSFKLTNSYKRHLATHENKRLFECNVCAQSFNSKGSLDRHVLIHTNERKFKCKYCEKSFNQPDVMRRHENIHVNKPQHKCNTCEKAFFTKTKLRLHELLHENKKQFKCKYCERPFNQPNAMRMHERSIHENIRPFKCELCEKVFSRKLNFKLHVLGHKNERKYKCDVCAKSFNALSQLHRHMRIHNTS